MTRRTLIVALTFTALLIPDAHARFNRARTDLSTGVTFPSDNSATLENPGALTGSPATLEVRGGRDDGSGAGVNSPYSAMASLVGNARSAGYGVGAFYNNLDVPIAFAGLGFGGKNFGVGLNGSYNFDGKSVDSDLGFHFGGKTRFGLGVVVNSLIGGPDSVTLGVGYRVLGKWRFEIDADYNLSGKSFTLIPGLGLMLGKKLSLAFGYSRKLEGSGSGTFRGGLNFWLSRKVALGFLYNYAPSTYTVMFKFGG